MRWDDLFADLEAQVSAAAAAEQRGEVGDRTRAETGRIGLLDRLRPSVGVQVSVRCAGDLVITGVLRRVGTEWLVIDEGLGREAILPVDALTAIAGLERWSAAPDSTGVVESRLGLRAALRAVARDRSPVRVHLRHDTAVLSGTLDRVGADFVELAAHASGETRRRADVRSVQVVPFAAVAAVRRDAGG